MCVRLVSLPGTWYVSDDNSCGRRAFLLHHDIGNTLAIIVGLGGCGSKDARCCHLLMHGEMVRICQDIMHIYAV